MAKIEETPHIRLRIPPRLRARLEKSREKSERTLTGEIVHRLEQSFRRDDTAEQIQASARGMVEILLDATEGIRPTEERIKRHFDEAFGKLEQKD